MQTVLGILDLMTFLIKKTYFIIKHMLEDTIEFTLYSVQSPMMEYSLFTAKTINNHIVL